MALYTVRWTKVLRVELEASTEVQAESEAEAQATALTQEENGLLSSRSAGWREVEREELSTHTDVFKEGEL